MITARIATVSLPSFLMMMAHMLPMCRTDRFWSQSYRALKSEIRSPWSSMSNQEPMVFNVCRPQPPSEIVASGRPGRKSPLSDSWRQDGEAEGLQDAVWTSKVPSEMALRRFMLGYEPLILASKMCIDVDELQAFPVTPREVFVLGLVGTPADARWLRCTDQLKRGMYSPQGPSTQYSRFPVPTCNSFNLTGLS